jgi:predicted nucleic acid-binding protein
VDNTALKTEQFSQSKARLVEWRAQNLTERFEHRVMPVDKRIALAWGYLMGDAKRSG